MTLTLGGFEMFKNLLTGSFLCLLSSAALAEPFLFVCEPLRGVSNTDDQSFVQKELSDLSPLVVNVEPSERRAAVVRNAEGVLPVPVVFKLVASNRDDNEYNFQTNFAFASTGFLISWNDNYVGSATRYVMTSANNRSVIDYECKKP
jgi:hypothetical protein